MDGTYWRDLLRPRYEGRRFVVLGPILAGERPNLAFLQDVLAHPVFQEGRADIGFIDREFEGWQPGGDPSLEVLVAAAMADGRLPQSLQYPSAGTYSPWIALQDFRLGQDPPATDP